MENQEVKTNMAGTLPAVPLQRLVSPLVHGTEEEHRGTLARAQANGVSYVWSGDVRRNEYLRENLRFGEEAGILTTRFVESDQESGWEISWANTLITQPREVVPRNGAEKTPSAGCFSPTSTD